ncbi:MAG: beta-lactamase family protein [Chloroflexi bacterium]|nr:beta-lactamase family protein [Chloroflexota bacterium]
MSDSLPSGLCRRLLTIVTVLWLTVGTASPSEGRTTCNEQAVESGSVETFSNQFFSRAMAEYGIPGVSFAVVQDGEVIFAEGYGYARLNEGIAVHPASTLFNAGSVGKLFTWTAVMQLVEQGLVDLNADVNEYLGSVHIAETYKQPVTLAHLLTHTAGFEDSIIGSLARTPEETLTPPAYAARFQPARVRAPGELTSYSNYGAALAGVIVEHVSGMPFHTYIQRHIFSPLGMDSSTFEQPLPHNLEARAAYGYTHQSDRFVEAPVYYANIMPAGMGYFTTIDIAHFIAAHLEGGEYRGRRILEPQTVAEMHRRQFSNDPRISGTTYGFLEYERNGRRFLWHTGTAPTQFHSLVLMAPDEGVGIVMCSNSVDRRLSHDLMVEFIDNFFPRAPDAVGTDAQPHSENQLARYAGSYRLTVHSHTTVSKVSAIGMETRIVANGDGTLTARQQTGETSDWAMIDPHLFKRIDGDDLLAFRESASQHITHLFFGSQPAFSYERIRWYDTTAFQLPLLIFSLSGLFGGLAAAPVGSLIRRRRHQVSQREAALARRARQAATLASALLVAFALGYVATNAAVVFAQSGLLVHLVYSLPILASGLTLGVIISAAMSWRQRWWTPVGRTLFTLNVLALSSSLWLLNYWNLLGFHF